METIEVRMYRLLSQTTTRSGCLSTSRAVSHSTQLQGNSKKVAISSIRLSHAQSDIKGWASAQKPSFVLLQCLLLALYLILLSVLYLIQLGMGLFCLIFLASLTFFLNVLMEP